MKKKDVKVKGKAVEAVEAAKKGVEMVAGMTVAPLPCPTCNALRNELLGSLRAAVAQMNLIAEKFGGSQDKASKESTEYNRYFGCAISCDTMLKEYFGFNPDAKDGVK